MSQSLVTIGLYNNPHQADMAKLHLELADIPVFLDNRFIVEMDWFLSNAVGNIRLQVPADQVDRARELLADLGLQTAHLAAKPDADLCLNCGADMPSGESNCPACGWTFDDADDEPAAE